MDTIDKHFKLPQRDVDKPFLMPIEHVYSIQGRGTVVTGRVERGKIKKNTECEVLGYGRAHKTVITGIEMFKKTLDEAVAGDSLGALLRGLKRDQVRRGMAIGQPGTFKPADSIEAQIYMLKKEEGGAHRPLLNTQRAQMYCKTWDCMAELVAKDKDMMLPGEDSSVAVKFLRPMIIEQGSRFTLRDRQNTIATGVVTKVCPDLTPEERAKMEKGKTRKEKEELERRIAEMEEAFKEQA